MSLPLRFDISLRYAAFRLMRLFSGAAVIDTAGQLMNTGIDMMSQPRHVTRYYAAAAITPSRPLISRFADACCMPPSFDAAVTTLRC